MLFHGPGQGHLNHQLLFTKNDQNFQNSTCASLSSADFSNNSCSLTHDLINTQPDQLSCQLFSCKQIAAPARRLSQLAVLI